MSSEFHAFMGGLRADARLGRYVAPLAGQSPEVIVLSLTQALADASEGRPRLHPAHELLDRMQEYRQTKRPAGEPEVKGTPHEN